MYIYIYVCVHVFHFLFGFRGVLESWRAIGAMQLPVPREPRLAPREAAPAPPAGGRRGLGSGTHYNQRSGLRLRNSISGSFADKELNFGFLYCKELVVGLFTAKELNFWFLERGISQIGAPLKGFGGVDTRQV